MLSGREPNHNEGRLFEKLEEKFGLWRLYDEKFKARTGKHTIDIHTHIIPGKTTEKDMSALKRIVERLGNVPWIVSTTGVNISESMAGRIIDFSPEAAKLVERYHTGPTATLSFGKGESQKLCSYISHGFYPFEQKRGVFGVTFNPYQKGQVQTCPYHSAIGTKEWFNLRDYLDVMKENEQPITDEHVVRWLEHARKVETIITQAAFDLVGYEHCLMRHSRKPEIDMFISRINIEMARCKKEGKLDIREKDYFDKVLKNLEDAIRIITVPSTKEKAVVNCKCY
jgi:hypothetical protein